MARPRSPTPCPLTSILRHLHAAAPDAEIIVVGADDPNIGAFAFADPLFTQLNQAQRAAAATVRARFADPFPVFNPQGDAAETTAICTLTLLCSRGDGHPSDAGYRALADVVWAASGYASFQLHPRPDGTLAACRRGAEPASQAAAVHRPAAASRSPTFPSRQQAPPTPLAERPGSHRRPAPALPPSDAPTEQEGTPWREYIMPR